MHKTYLLGMGKRFERQGTTACCIMKIGQQIWTANAGDSRAGIFFSSFFFRVFLLTFNPFEFYANRQALLIYHVTTSQNDLMNSVESADRVGT
jgi:hypothetical protein